MRNEVCRAGLVLIALSCGSFALLHAAAAMPDWAYAIPPAPAPGARARSSAARHVEQEDSRRAI